jgi:tetratricopeptide (TPR) repeat protein
MGRARWSLGDTIASLELCKQGIERTLHATASIDQADLLSATAGGYFFAGDMMEAEAMCRRSLAMARDISAKRVEADTLITLGMLPTLPMEDALSSFEQAIAICQAEGFLDVEGRAQNNLGVIHDALGANFRRALVHYHAAGEVSRQIGDKAAELFSLSNAAWSEVVLGEMASARKSITYLEELLGELPESEASRQIYRVCLAQFEHGVGNFTEASELRSELFQDSLEAGDLINIAIDSRYLGLALVDRGKLDEAVTVLLKGVEAADEISMNRVLTRAILTQILARNGDADRARQAYTEAEEIHREHNYPRSEMRLRMANADLVTAEQRWDEMPTAFEHASQALERAEARLWRAGLLRDWAEAHLQRGKAEDPARAMALLREALSDYEAMGSPGYVRRIHARIEELDRPG